MNAKYTNMPDTCLVWKIKQLKYIQLFPLTIWHITRHLARGHFVTYSTVNAGPVFHAPRRGVNSTRDLARWDRQTAFPPRGNSTCPSRRLTCVVNKRELSPPAKNLWIYRWRLIFIKWWFKKKITKMVIRGKYSIK